MSTPSELRALLKAATPGPWALGWDSTDGLTGRGSVILADDIPLFDPRPEEGEWIALSDADAALIVAAVNALPKLLDLWETAEEVAKSRNSWQGFDAFMTAMEGFSASLAALSQPKASA